MDSKALTDAEIDRILELEAKAHEGPWCHFTEGGGRAKNRIIAFGTKGAEDFGKVVIRDTLAGHPNMQDRGDEDNFDFIAAARNSIRSLAEEVKRSRARIEAAPQAVMAVNTANTCDPSEHSFDEDGICLNASCHVHYSEVIEALRAELAKRDEPVKVESYGTVGNIGVCACGEDTTGPNYCGMCGKRLEWS